MGHEVQKQAFPLFFEEADPGFGAVRRSVRIVFKTVSADAWTVPKAHGFACQEWVANTCAEHIRLERPQGRYNTKQMSFVGVGAWQR